MMIDKASLKKPLKNIYPEVEWRVEDAPVPYDRALAFMEARAGQIRNDGACDYVWLLEHPPVYTAGTSADPKDLLDNRFPVFEAGRGGQYTYHGPGQRVGYLMMDLQHRGSDLRLFVHNLEEWVIRTLAVFDVKGERREGRVGIWIDMQPYGGKKGAESKIAAIGVRVRKWVTFHGVSINVNPDLSHYKGIVPCGLSQYGVTSLQELGIKVGMPEIDLALRSSFKDVFGS